MGLKINVMTKCFILLLIIVQNISFGKVDVSTDRIEISDNNIIAFTFTCIDSNEAASFLKTAAFCSRNEIVYKIYYNDFILDNVVHGNNIYSSYDDFVLINDKYTKGIKSMLLVVDGKFIQKNMNELQLIKSRMEFKIPVYSVNPTGVFVIKEYAILGAFNITITPKGKILITQDE